LPICGLQRLLVLRGSCSFALKAFNAYTAGVAVMALGNSDPQGTVFPMMTSSTAPTALSFMISYTDYMRLGAALSPETLRDFNLDKPLDSDVFQKQKIAIEIGHCHALPSSAFKGMVNAQVARDVWMAKTVRDNASNGLILLAGNGHVRKDIGVYHWLSSAERARTQVIAYIEGDSDTVKRPEAELYDRSISIEPFERDDPCEAFTGKVKIQT
jgi:hypothetical protein